MKHLALFVILALFFSVKGQEVPPFLKGYDYYTTRVQAADGSSFEAFEVSDIVQAKALKKDIKQLKCWHTFRIDKSGLRITKRVIGEWTVMTFTGVDFIRVNVFVE